MDSILGTFEKYANLKEKEDDDIIDRLSSRYTAFMLIVCAAIVSLYQFDNKPVSCWTPAHFSGAWNKYTAQYCWVHNMYYVPFDEEIPDAENAAQREKMLYYQWIPFILLFMALLFYVPSVVWHSLNQKAGIDSDHILLAANRLELTDSTTYDDAEAIDRKRGEYRRMIVNQMHRFLGAPKHKHKKEAIAGSGHKKKLTAALHCCGSNFGSYLVTLFMFSKLLYLANVIFQFFFLSKILGIKYPTYGFEIMKGMWRDHDWTESHGVAFPRVAFCDFSVRRLGNVHRYSTQCTLILNMFNEKIFIMLWFWFLLVAIFTVLGIVTWLLRVFMTNDRLLFVRNHLKMGGRMTTSREATLSAEFVTDYMKQDGCFLLRLISTNTNRITTTEVILALWDNWLEKVHPDHVDQDDNDDSDDHDDLEDEKVPFSEDEKLYPSLP